MYISNTRLDDVRYRKTHRAQNTKFHSRNRTLFMHPTIHHVLSICITPRRRRFHGRPIYPHFSIQILHATSCRYHHRGLGHSVYQVYPTSTRTPNQTNRVFLGYSMVHLLRADMARPYERQWKHDKRRRRDIQRIHRFLARGVIEIRLLM